MLTMIIFVVKNHIFENRHIFKNEKFIVNRLSNKKTEKIDL